MPIGWQEPHAAMHRRNDTQWSHSRRFTHDCAHLDSQQPALWFYVGESLADLAKYSTSNAFAHIKITHLFVQLFIFS